MTSILSDAIRSFHTLCSKEQLLVVMLVGVVARRSWDQDYWVVEVLMAGMHLEAMPHAPHVYAECMYCTVLCYISSHILRLDLYSHWGLWSGPLAGTCSRGARIFAAAQSSVHVFQCVCV